MLGANYLGSGYAGQGYAGTLTVTYTTFTPPLVDDVPPILPDSKGPAFRLFRYYQPRQRYAAVYLLSDGTFAQDVATTENDNTNIPTPWNPYELNAPFFGIQLLRLH